MVQVSFITNYSTGLAPFPRLSAPPHSSHTPIAPRRPGGYSRDCALLPPSPLSRGEPVRAAAAYLLPRPGFRHQCNKVDWYGKKEAGTGEHLTHFNNKINKHKWKAPHRRLPHTKHKLKSRPGPLSSSTVVTPHLTLPKLLRGTRDRWVVQVSFITNYSTGLAPFPRLSAPPHSSQSLIIIKIKRNKHLKYISLCGMNVYIIQVSLFEWN